MVKRVVSLSLVEFSFSLFSLLFFSYNGKKSEFSQMKRLKMNFHILKLFFN